MNKLDKQNIEDILPLTPTQEGMFFHYLENPDSRMYYEQIAFTLNGKLDLNIFTSAWEIVVASNETMRTVFRWKNIQKPVQIVLKTFNLPLIYHDLSVEKEPQKALEILKRQDRETGIDIQTQPYHILLCKLSSQTHEMILTSFHILLDGWSNSILIQELMNIYEIISKGHQPIRSKFAPYKAYIEYLQKKDFSQGKAYWRTYLQDVAEKTEIPPDYLSGYNHFIEADIHFDIQTEIWNQIKSLTKLHNIKPATIFITTWGILLQRYCQLDKVVYGITVANRPIDMKMADRTVGLFINTIPIKLRYDSEESGLHLLERMEKELIEHSEYEDVPLNEILKQTSLKNGLFDSIVVIENYPQNRQQNLNISVKISTIYESTNYAITLVIDGGSIRILYNKAQFQKETIELIAEEYLTLLQDVVYRLDKSVGNLNLLPRTEDIKVREMFNNTGTGHHNDQTVYERFCDQAARYPDNVAVVFHGVEYTYKMLEQRVNNIAAFLTQRIIQPKEAIVAVMKKPSFDRVACLLALFRIGACYLPVDTEIPIERLQYMLREVKCKYLLTDTDIFDKMEYTALFQRELDTKADGFIILNPPRPPIENFDSLPMPDRSLIDVTKYKNHIGMASVNNCISLQTTRGCPYQCLYCHKIWSKRHFRRTPENIFEEVLFYYNQGVRNFAIVDDCFNLNRQHVEQFMTMIIHNKLDIQLFFPNGLRGDILTSSLIDQMVEAGTRGINLSLETASPRLQKLLKKNLDLDRFSENIEYIATRHSNIILELATMHGFPTETEDEAMVTLEFIRNIKWIHFPYVHILKIFPNTEMETFALEHGVSKQDILISRDRAFHELPETLPFPKAFTRKYQSIFLNGYFLDKVRLQKVLPVQARILEKSALIQKYNAYLPTEIKSFQDIVDLAGLDVSVLPSLPKSASAVPEFFDKSAPKRPIIPKAKRILLLDVSQQFESHEMLYKVSEQPLGHLYLMTYLKREFGNSIDGRIYKSGVDFNSYDELKVLVDEFKPDLIGLRTLTYFKNFLHKTVAYLRMWGIISPIIVGGPYASSDYDTLLLDRHIDFAIIGEGELTLTEVVQAYMKNGFHKLPVDVLKDIKGIAYRRSDDPADIVPLDILLCENINNIENPLNITTVAPASKDNLAYIMYTSGSTGKPKGVMIEHQQVNNCIDWMQNTFPLRETDRVLARTQLTFDPSVWELFWPLSCGAAIVLTSEEESRNVEYISNQMTEKNGITAMYMPASMLSIMNYFLASLSTPPKLHLPILFTGAETVKMKTVKELYRYLDGRIVNTYGPTECTINNTFYEISRNDDHDFVPIGRPIDNNKIFILSRNGKLMPKRAYGEICIAGNSVARGYVADRDAENPVFVYHPQLDMRIYKTGDIGRWTHDGILEIAGRMDNQIKLRGYRIELGEVERAMVSHSSVSEAVVTIPGYSKQNTKPNICPVCGLTSDYPLVEISEDKCCSVCKEYETYKVYLEAYFQPLSELERIIKSTTKTDSPFDCLLIYNGGRGAAYALYLLTNMGLRIMAVTIDNGYLSPKALQDIRYVVGSLNINHTVLRRENAKDILDESCITAGTVCKGCFYMSSIVAGEYAIKNRIPVVINATLSRGQIIENKLLMLLRQGITELSKLEKMSEEIQKSLSSIDPTIFKAIDSPYIYNGSLYSQVKFIDFYRYCNVNRSEILEALSRFNSFWIGKDGPSVYSTNCPVKALGDHYHLQEKSYSYYGLATAWEVRLGHQSIEQGQKDLEDTITLSALNRFCSKRGISPPLDKGSIDERYLCGYYVAAEEIPTIKWKEYLSRYLPTYSIPSRFVRLNEIPLARNGKVDRSQLPEPVEPPTNRELEEPTDVIEMALVEVWRRFLPSQQIGVRDSFFDLGGNSILLIQVHVQLERLYPNVLKVADLFTYTTIQELADVIRQRRQKTVILKDAKSVPLPGDFFVITNNKEEGYFLWEILPGDWCNIQNLSRNLKANPIEVLSALSLYLLYEVTENRLISVYLAESSGIRELICDFSEINDIQALVNRIVSRLQEAVAQYPEYRYIKQKGYVHVLFCIDDLPDNSVNYDIIFMFNETTDKKSISLFYNQKILSHNAMEKIFDRYISLIEILSSNIEKSYNY